MAQIDIGMLVKKLSLDLFRELNTLKTKTKDGQINLSCLLSHKCLCHLANQELHLTSLFVPY